MDVAMNGESEAEGQRVIDIQVIMHCSKSVRNLISTTQ